MDEACILMGLQTSEQGATIPTESTTPLYTSLSCECRVVEMASSDGERAQPTSPPIYYTFFEDIMTFLYCKERSHPHIYMYI